MKVKTILLLALPIFLLASIFFNSDVHASEERKVLSRNYVGLGVNVYAPYQCYPAENITVRVRIEALEDLKNVSMTVFIWGSKSEGHNPWGTSFTVLDHEDFPTATIKEEAYNIMMPSDIDPGLTYGILFLDWSIYRTSSWEDQWDKASFRVTYVQNKHYEDLQAACNELQSKHDSVLSDLQISRTIVYAFLTTTMVLAVSTLYLGRRSLKQKGAKKLREHALSFQ